MIATEMTIPRRSIAPARYDPDPARFRIRQLGEPELEDALPALTALLVETVNGGAPLGFLGSITHDEAQDYLLSLRAELRTGSRVMLAAIAGSSVVGSVQLCFARSPNARHRAEMQKLFVARAARGTGIGRALVAAVHDAARAHGRSLITLNTRLGGPAELFYIGLGYREAGMIPGWSRGPSGERVDHVTLYQELPTSAETRP